MKVNKPVVYGITASLGLMLFYFVILSLLNSSGHAIQQFLQLWYFMVPLIVGFGLQVGFYFYIRESIKSKAGTVTCGMAGSVSGISMVACCAHHLVDVLPILIGISAATIFLARFQNLFLMIGILSNVIGITMMLKIVKEHNLYRENTVLAKISRFNMKRVFYITCLFSLAIFVYTLTISL